MAPAGSYRDCFVAFLDILGFRQLVDRSVADRALMRKISGITTLTAAPRSGIKQTSLGPCFLQVRAFSDSVVVFTPSGYDHAANPLAQVCFVVRYLHDRVLEMGSCLRGGVTAGPMYWHPSWGGEYSRPRRGTRGALPITFGPGLNSAYDLETKHAVYPRVLVDDTVSQRVLDSDLTSWPFGADGIHLHQLFRSDPVDGWTHLDLLSPVAVRAEGERMRSSPHGFTITWQRHSDSAHPRILRQARELAKTNIHDNVHDVRTIQKYEWLRDYSAP